MLVIYLTSLFHRIMHGNAVVKSPRIPAPSSGWASGETAPSASSPSRPLTGACLALPASTGHIPWHILFSGSLRASDASWQWSSLPQLEWSSYLLIPGRSGWWHSADQSLAFCPCARSTQPNTPRMPLCVGDNLRHSFTIEWTVRQIYSALYWTCRVRSWISRTWNLLSLPIMDNISVSLFCRDLCGNLLLPAGSFLDSRFGLLSNVLPLAEF